MTRRQFLNENAMGIGAVALAYLPQGTDSVAVDIESQLGADSTFHQLLGNDPSERYRIIMDDASFADHVDVRA